MTMSDTSGDAWDIAALDALITGQEIAAASARQTADALAARAAENVETLADLDALPMAEWPAKLVADGFGGYLTTRAARDGRTRRPLLARAEKRDASSFAESFQSWEPEFGNSKSRSRSTSTRGASSLMFDRDGDPVNPSTLREVRRLRERRLISDTEARGMLGLRPKLWRRLLPW
jgi:hypothetical protein